MLRNFVTPLEMEAIEEITDEFAEDGEDLFISVENLKHREDALDDVWAMRSWDGEVLWDDDVAILNGRNFQRFIKKVPHVLVEFFAPWCGHCQKFEPIFRRAASHLRMEVLDPIPLLTPASTGKTPLRSRESQPGQVGARDDGARRQRVEAVLAKVDAMAEPQLTRSHPGPLSLRERRPWHGLFVTGAILSEPFRVGHARSWPRRRTPRRAPSWPIAGRGRNTSPASARAR